MGQSQNLNKIGKLPNISCLNNCTKVTQEKPLNVRKYTRKYLGAKGQYIFNFHSNGFEKKVCIQKKNDKANVKCLKLRDTGKR